MNAEEMISSHTRKEMINLGFSERDANETANLAVRKFRRNTKHQDAIADAIKEGKKLFKKVKK